MNGAGFRALTFTLAACGLAPVVLALLSATSPQSTRPSHEAHIKRAITQLIDEARAAAKEDAFIRFSPDFAKRFDGEIANDELIAAISRPAHKEPFIDGYVRWQLTSFDPSWPALDDATVLKLMAATPKLLENPRAEPAAVEAFKRADGQSQLSSIEVRRLNELADDLTKRSDSIKSFNTPAEGFRDWVRSKIESADLPASELLWLIERCHATISAGWPSRSIKAQMTKAFREAGLNRDITPEQRGAVAEQARKLIGLKRTTINEITFMDNGSVNVSFSTYAVDEDDVNSWIPLLHGQSN